MKRATPEQIRHIFPNASKSTLAANLDVDGSPQGTEPQSPLCHEPVATAKGKAGHTGRYVVRITSYRSRLCDPDNLIGKYFLDCIRMAKIIPDDREEDIVYQINQKKVEKEAEKTLITVEYPY